MEKKFAEIDRENRWPQSYLEIRNESQDFPYKVAKYPENQNRNRYRDVSPFDHSRVKLQKADNDYINASLIIMEEAQRNYILTQGPLPNSCGHFWQMAWEQKSRAIVMLNRVIEKGSVKCEKYWPSTKDETMSYEDTGFNLRLLCEDIKSYYTVRQLELQRTSFQNNKKGKGPEAKVWAPSMTGETREIYHFHYTTWPDFGVPESPASFLNFLFKVRESGCLNSDCGPTVVHCSAGIGRSGTFSLVDTCLVLKRWKELSNEDQEPIPGNASPPPQPPKRALPRHNENKAPHLSVGEATDAANNISTEENSVQEKEIKAKYVNNIRKRHREDRIAGTAQKVQRMKQKLNETEVKRKRWLYWKPILINIAAVTTLAIGAIVCCSMYFQ
ncbi:tyrosine-protein phosphatase non-receptor type 2 isoform X6 [Mobula hypostoma]|uniref:tyrosine-protein phosphatase non-receptor type 2 isoform X6 n=1 Tax=Mobula hypostoma TaxID=723540 RepID=UPI002FC30CD8